VELGAGSAGGGGDLAIRRGRERLRRDFEAGEKKMESLGSERARAGQGGELNLTVCGLALAEERGGQKQKCYTVRRNDPGKSVNYAMAAVPITRARIS
jgi:hypothetical protein